MAFLDKAGVEHLWTHIISKLGNKVDKIEGKGLSTNDYTTDEKTKLAGIATGANKYSLPASTADALGGIKIGYTQSGKNYPVALDSNSKAYVNVPWSDTNTDTKVTAVGNHYTPSGGTTTSASGGTLTDITNSSSGVQVVTGVTKDAAGHVTGVTSLALKSVNTVYTHPSTHPATMITEDSTHRFVTDTEKVTWNNKASKSTITTATLLVSSWDSSAKTYSFESTYPNASYDIEVALDSIATAEQAEAFNGAQIVGSATSNIIKAYGDVPTVDIPVIVKEVNK